MHSWCVAFISPPPPVAPSLTTQLRISVVLVDRLPLCLFACQSNFKQSFCFFQALDEQKTGAQKEVNDLRLALRDAEKPHVGVHRENQKLRQVKHLEGERNRLEQEVLELQHRVTHHEEKAEELRRELFTIKQKVRFAINK